MDKSIRKQWVKYPIGKGKSLFLPYIERSVYIEEIRKGHYMYAHAVKKTDSDKGFYTNGLLIWNLWNKSWRVPEIPFEMTVSVRFCLSYGCFRQGFVGLKGELISSKKRDVVKDGVMTIRASNEALYNVLSYIRHTSYDSGQTSFVWCWYRNRLKSYEDFRLYTCNGLTTYNFLFWKRRYILNQTDAFFT